ncbi:hypothetical protein WS67_08330 [Burkholderia singularis]|uniref:Uncharacterized protein n=1 Tax=Burkholderia singularis TaxID=1503053 RepID=A0A103E5V2_9BURK|nr:ferritin-like domain-containing protein [Burkholderia singularis]KVE28947.1 hypothetical protein WS67_08330 [Burkholderia singularis]
MTSPREYLEDWLRDAYAMERQAETMLSAQLSRLDNYPLLHAQLRQHLDETRIQQTLVEGCLRRLGTTPSAIKDLAARIAAYGQVAGGLLAEDEVVKHAMACYMFEQVEIAAYTVLIVAADAAGESEIRANCERLRQQEFDMASWLARQLPDITTAFLERSSVERSDAKR